MLVGRSVLLEAGERALREALGGHGRLLLLLGEAGIGKTALATALLERAASCGAVVRVGACWEGDGLPALAPWLDALRRPGGDACAAAASHLAADDTESIDAPSARRAVSRRFGDIVDALATDARDSPQVVLLEDLHWADEPSLELLAALAAHLPRMRVLVIATYRDDELPRVGPIASVGGGGDRLWLGGLDGESVRAVLEDVVGRRPTDEEVELVERQTSGNPLFVTQVARLLHLGVPTLPSGVRDILERRLARVSAACDRVLGAAAVLGAELDERDLAELAGSDVAELLDEATAARLLEPVPATPGRWRFVHALVQAARYEQLGTEERGELHRDAVRVLQLRPGTTAAALAHHATRGRFHPEDPQPARLLALAGDEALRRMAWTDACSSYERALALAPTSGVGDEVRAEAWLGIGSARLRAGTGDVRAAFDEAASWARRLGRSDLLARAALGFGVGLGAFEVRLVDLHQIELLEEAATSLPAEDPLVPLVLARLSVALAFVGSDERRIDLSTRAVDLARAAGEPVALGHALAAWCDTVAGPDAVAERAAASTEIVRLAERAGDLPLELLGRRLRVVALLERNDHMQVDAEIAAYERASDRLGDPLYAWYARLWRALGAYADGDLARADALLAQVEELGEASSSVNAVVLATVFGFMTALDRRDTATADRLLGEMSSTMPDTIGLYLDVTSAYSSALLGRFDEARAALDRLTDDVVARVPRDSEWLCCLAQLAVASARAGDQRWAAVARDRLAPFADLACVEGIGAYLHGPAHRYLAMTSAVLGDVEGTRSHAEAALREVAGAGRLIEALVAFDTAWALRHAGDPVDTARAQELLDVAARSFRAVGMSALAAEAAGLVAAGPVHTRMDAGPVLDRTPSAVRQGDTWAWSWDGVTVQVRHAKGVADLALLLERAGREVHVRELEGVATMHHRSGLSDPVLDEEAVRSYRQRLHDLEEELDEADRHGDLVRAAALAAERDTLVAELARAFGVGGRARRVASDPDERLRKAVSARVRASIERIESLSPPLGKHLRAAVRTGFWCAYEPEHPVDWTVVRS